MNIKRIEEPNLSYSATAWLFACNSLHYLHTFMPLLTLVVNSHPGSFGLLSSHCFHCSPSIRAKGSGGDEGHRPRVQQRSHPVQQLCQLRRRRYRTAGIPDSHWSEHFTLELLLTGFLSLIVGQFVTYNTFLEQCKGSTVLRQTTVYPLDLNFLTFLTCSLFATIPVTFPSWLFSGKCSETIFEDMREPPKKPLHLKGQMKYVPQWDSLIFLGTPM